METFIGLGYFLNPLFAVVFCINLVIIIQKLFKDNKANIDKHAIWLTISFTYIVTSLTWMSAY